MKDEANERSEVILDRLALGLLDRRSFLTMSAAGLVAASAPAMAQAIAAGENQRRNRRDARDAYDYIVVGAGTAGCIIAARLTAKGNDVLLLEAGGTDDSPQIATPGLWFTNLGSDREWRYHTDRSSAIGREAPVAAGRVLGGGGSINAMAWGRGTASDFDGWRAAGCKGWGFADLLPLFREVEDWEGGASSWRGAGGPVPITTSKDLHPVAASFLEAAREMRIPLIDDLNAPMRPGAGRLNLNITKEGTRASAARCFLRPMLDRPNLTLLLDRQVQRLTLNGTRCVGVAVSGVDGRLQQIRARREVIVTSGAIGSAKLLMLSGLGDPQALRAIGVKSSVALPGVGQNLQDHALVLGVTFGFKGSMPAISPHSNAGEVAAFVKSSQARSGADLEILPGEYAAVTPEIRAKYGAPPKDAFTLAVACIQPTGRGSLKLTSADWRAAPTIKGPYLATDHDLAVTAEGIELARALGNAQGYREIRSSELIPNSKLGKAALYEFARNAAISFGHASGTCAMGVHDGAVVDHQLRVRGTEGLRVCDSSVMPIIVSAPPNAATHVIALKASALLGA